MVRGRGESISDLEAMFGISINFEAKTLSKPFLIITDASNYTLEQSSYKEKTKEDHPAEFASRLLNPAEKETIRPLNEKF
ncbi:hypothetical protein TNCV_2849751 [Trichonephila clavipes]|nr:hypothetical protein TNCV_2849751 [Trichonephila clavipes]